VVDGANGESYITPAHGTRLRRTDRSGPTCHWILAVHLVYRERGFGGLREELLSLG
jgi:hypothetical protein